MNDKIKLFVFWYCCCIYESSSFPMSYHKTEQGAIKAMNKHKNKAKRQWLKFTNKEDMKLSGLKFGMHESWSVEPFELEILD